jgi:hypothetical protein
VKVTGLFAIATPGETDIVMLVLAFGIVLVVVVIDVAVDVAV